MAPNVMFNADELKELVEQKLCIALLYLVLMSAVGVTEFMNVSTWGAGAATLAAVVIGSIGLFFAWCALTICVGRLLRSKRSSRQILPMQVCSDDIMPISSRNYSENGPLVLIGFYSVCVVVSQEVLLTSFYSGGAEIFVLMTIYCNKIVLSTPRAALLFSWACNFAGILFRVSIHETSFLYIPASLLCLGLVYNYESLSNKTFAHSRRHAAQLLDIHEYAERAKSEATKKILDLQAVIGNSAHDLKVTAHIHATNML
jgi:hypothetical protein